ncbi:acyl-CoA carboxylase subunit epsilon [Brachybacterium sp. EF45031]|uniref:acyl-CoA carboxylase subunit epsilon n=1 Tax=Brachybacterium sillae TaxID=2810536 RepID=UPI00217DBDE4|nr:acyl-CoA carboxylase subunit epsilon [Brachybacterium sillae]MCS6711055.1 acyl-CoA carboxylase subunit epsilon [Brachybacterium sillae]
MSNPESGTATDPGEQPDPSPDRPEVRLVSGRLSDTELAAIAVTLAAINAASHVEARERELAEGGPGRADAWSDPALGLPGAHRLRTAPSPTAWQFSDR